jgi:hypothetical protein
MRKRCGGRGKEGKSDRGEWEGERMRGERGKRDWERRGV